MKNTLLILAASALFSSTSMAATIDGQITNGSEYIWNTDGAEGNGKWNTQYTTGSEYDDASTSDPWDINYLGVSVTESMFQFGAVGGSILSGKDRSQGIDLGHFALSIQDFNENASIPDPTTSSAGFNYAIELLSVDDQSGVAEFQLLTGGTWIEANMYQDLEGHVSQTYQMTDATVVETFSGAWNFLDGDDNVLEGEFNLSSIGFNAEEGANIATYLTMACVNDEAMVLSSISGIETISSVPEPSTYALMLGGLGLVGFMARRRKQA